MNIWRKKRWDGSFRCNSVEAGSLMRCRREKRHGGTHVWWNRNRVLTWEESEGRNLSR